MRASLFAFPTLVAGFITPYAAGEPSDALQNILKNSDNTNKYKYPTDFTRGIIPVRRSITDATLLRAHTTRNRSTATTTTGAMCRFTRDCRMVLSRPRLMFGWLTGPSM
jgi:hypothetical protein